VQIGVTLESIEAVSPSSSKAGGIQYSWPDLDTSVPALHSYFNLCIISRLC